MVGYWRSCSRVATCTRTPCSPITGALIGIPADYTCRVDVVTPKHVRFTLRQAGTVRRVGDIELVDSNTTRAIHRVSPASGAPYTETAIWLRDRD
jgi:hypothetical protein